ncbi:hypothetical protein GCM10010869_22170 [Mesorhizobium tianshanense]|nr:hypothetical protein GCM10010869_22170 [Mesorhizobium tianshanense]
MPERPVAWAMKITRPSYSPAVLALPFLAVVLALDGTATARPFDTAEDAAALNRLMAAAWHLGKIGN